MTMMWRSMMGLCVLGLASFLLLEGRGSRSSTLQLSISPRLSSRCSRGVTSAAKIPLNQGGVDAGRRRIRNRKAVVPPPPPRLRISNRLPLLQVYANYKNRGRDIGPAHKVDPWLRYDDLKKKAEEEEEEEEEDDEDGTSISKEDTYRILEGYHPSMSPEDVEQWKQQKAEDDMKKAEALKKKAEANAAKKQKGASKLVIEDRQKPPQKFRYRGRNKETGYVLHRDMIRKGAISDYYDPWDLKQVSYTQGWKLGMAFERFPRGLDTAQQVQELRKMLATNFSCQEPFTGYMWDYTTNLTVASKFTWRGGKPLLEDETPGTLLAMTAVNLPSAASIKRQGGVKSNKTQKAYDHVALYVDAKGAREWFGDHGAAMIPLDDEAYLVPGEQPISSSSSSSSSSSRVLNIAKRAVEWYFQGWPDRLNPLPPRITTAFSRQDEAYGQALLAGRFSKRLVIRFGASHGVKRWRGVFEAMKAQCSSSSSSSSSSSTKKEGASELYRFERFMESIDEAIRNQEDLDDGEIVIDFDSHNRMKFTVQRGSQFLHIPLEDELGAFQGLEPSTFRAGELIMGALLSNHKEPFSHLKSIFIGAAKQIFTQPDKEKSMRVELANLEKMLVNPDNILLEDGYDQVMAWNTEYEMRKEKPMTFQEREQAIAKNMLRMEYLQLENLRTRDEDRSRSMSHRPPNAVEEEDPYQVAKRIEAEKNKIKNPLKLPKSKDGLTHQFSPQAKEDVGSIEYLGEMKDRKRELREIMSEFDLQYAARTVTSHLERTVGDKVNKSYTDREESMMKEGYMYVYNYFPRRPEEGGLKLSNLEEEEGEDEDPGGFIPPVRRPAYSTETYEQAETMPQNDEQLPDLGDDFPSMATSSNSRLALPAPSQAGLDISVLLAKTSANYYSQNNAAAAAAGSGATPSIEQPLRAVPDELKDEFPSMDQMDLLETIKAAAAAAKPLEQQQHQQHQPNLAPPLPNMMIEPTLKPMPKSLVGATPTTTTDIDEDETSTNNDDNGDNDNSSLPPGLG